MKQLLKKHPFLFYSHDTSFCRSCIAVNLVYNTCSNIVTLVMVWMIEWFTSSSSQTESDNAMARCSFSPSALRIWERVASIQAMDDNSLHMQSVLQSISQQHGCLQVQGFKIQRQKQQPSGFCSNNKKHKDEPVTILSWSHSISFMTPSKGRS